MYRGFNVEKLTINDTDGHWYEQGLALFNKNKQNVMLVLRDFTLNDGILDGSKMQSDWFPQINSHIFISHSHKDEDTVIEVILTFSFV